MIHDAVDNALSFKDGKSFSDGVMVVGKSDTHVAVSFNNTPHSENTIMILRRADAISLATLILSATNGEQTLNQN